LIRIIAGTAGIVLAVIFTAGTRRRSVGGPYGEPRL